MRPRFGREIVAEKINILMNLFIHLYMYAGELLVCPPFGLQRVISLATLRVISLSTFLGPIFAL